MLVTVHTQRKSFLLASGICYVTVPSTIIDLLQFLVYNKPLDIRGMRGTLFPISGTFLGIGFCSFFRDRIFMPFISFNKPSSDESAEIKPDHEGKTLNS